MRRILSVEERPRTMMTQATWTATEGLHTLLTAAGWAPLQDVGWIAVTGSDRVRWLNGMVTNSVQALRPGEGAYTFLLNAQGRIQGDATVWCEEGRLLLEMDRAQVEGMMELLDRFIIMDDVELEDLSDSVQGVLIAGPRAAEVLTELGIAVRPSRLLKRSSIPWNGASVEVISAYGPQTPRFELWLTTTDASKADLNALTSRLSEVNRESVELLRILEGVPRYGIDIREKDLPQETAQTRALHFSKGCYLGQEIVERIRSRGQVHRTFAQFALSGTVPAPGTELLADGKAVGVLTTVAAEAIDGEHLALGYVRREAMDRKLPLSYEGGTANVRVEAPGGQPASNA